MISSEQDVGDGDGTRVGDGLGLTSGDGTTVGVGDGEGWTVGLGVGDGTALADAPITVENPLWNGPIPAWKAAEVVLSL